MFLNFICAVVAALMLLLGLFFLAATFTKPKDGTFVLVGLAMTISFFVLSVAFAKMGGW